VSLAASHAIRYLAFVAAPPLFMVLLLTTRPAQGLALRWPPWWGWLAGAASAVLLLPSFSVLTRMLLDQFPHLKQAAVHGSTNALPKLQAASLLVFVILPSVCEELAFRGFILSGLRRRFRPWPAVLLSSFLYALYQMNVLQALPHFLLGTVLALLVLRTSSIGSAVVFRLVWESLLWGPLLAPRLFSVVNWIDAAMVLTSLILAAPLLIVLRPPSAFRNPLVVNRQSG
jgi:sodium transport system permease protein